MMIIIFLLTLVISYLLVWAYLLTIYFLDHRRVVKLFLTAWETDRLSCIPLDGGYTSERYRFIFADGRNDRSFTTDEDGRVVSHINWKNDRTYLPKRPWPTLRKPLEEVTTQVVTMEKLKLGLNTHE